VNDEELESLSTRSCNMHGCDNEMFLISKSGSGCGYETKGIYCETKGIYCENDNVL